MRVNFLIKLLNSPLSLFMFNFYLRFRGGIWRDAHLHVPLLLLKCLLNFHKEHKTDTYFVMERVQLSLFLLWSSCWHHILGIRNLIGFSYLCQVAFQVLMAGALRCVCIFAPFIAFQAYGYYNMCLGHFPDKLRPWCNARLPLLYNYIQSYYWYDRQSFSVDTLYFHVKLFSYWDI